MIKAMLHVCLLGIFRACSATPVSKPAPAKSLAPVSKMPDLPNLDFSAVLKSGRLFGNCPVSKLPLSCCVTLFFIHSWLLSHCIPSPFPSFLTIVIPTYVYQAGEHNLCHFWDFPETEDSRKICSRLHQTVQTMETKSPLKTSQADKVEL